MTTMSADNEEIAQIKAGIESTKQSLRDSPLHAWMVPMLESVQADFIEIADMDEDMAFSIMHMFGFTESEEPDSKTTKMVLYGRYSQGIGIPFVEVMRTALEKPFPALSKRETQGIVNEYVRRLRSWKQTQDEEYEYVQISFPKFILEYMFRNDFKMIGCELCALPVPKGTTFKFFMQKTEGEAAWGYSIEFCLDDLLTPTLH